LNFLVAFVSLAFVPEAAGQYRLDTWTTDNGLPQNSVTGLAQTPDQYIWFTTNDGLVRFDGVRFKVFNKSNTPEITSNRLSSAFTDKMGRLWFRGEDNSILYYHKGVFTVAAMPGELQPGTLSRFFDDGSGNVVINRDRRPYQYQSGRFVPLRINGVEEDSPAIASGQRSGLWFAGKDVLYSYRDNDLKTQSIAGHFNEKDYLFGYEDRQGGVWTSFFTSDHWSLLRTRDGWVTEIPSEPVNQMAEDPQGNLWVSVYRKGLYRIDRSFLAADHVPPTALELVMAIDGLSANISGHMLFDREGGIWIGTEKGLNRISPQTVNVFAKKDGLKEVNVYPLLVDRQGSLWAGVWPNGLVRYQNGGFVSKVGSETDFVSSLFEDSSGRLWFGNLRDLYFLENERPVRFTDKIGFEDLTEFSAIEESKDGALWFGTSRGLARYKDGRTTIFTTKNGLPDDYLVTLLETRDGKLWIGTRGGLSVYHNDSFRSFTVSDGIASNSIRSLYEDNDGVLWIGSYDGGLTRLKDGRFTVFSMRDGLSSNGVFCILEDAAGWFWMNSNQGIYRVNRRELNDFADGKVSSLTSISYNKKDGLLNVEGNGGRQPAGAQSADGRLWFPTAEGIAVVDPAKVAVNQIPPPVLIEDVTIDRNVVPNDTLHSALAGTSSIELQPGQSNLEIHYTALSFVNSEHLKFKYKLDNQDEGWNDADTRRTAYYSYLPPGEYVFKVIAANRDGVWNESEARLAIVVHPPFYKTWWFLLISILLVALMVGLVFYLRIRQLQLREKQREEFARQLIASQESERGRIAAEMHDGLGQSLAIIKNRAMLSLSKPDDQDHAHEQLREIAEASSEAIDEVHEIIYDLRPIQLDRLGLTGALEDIAERVTRANELRLSMKVDNIDERFPSSPRTAYIGWFRNASATWSNIRVQARWSLP
jgi:ligand-binding sensor domain-containing protein